ncbi:hypothetical protein [Pseudomonas oryzihabitans]|uniref:hypothetical protein n=1 Tax=Pseudomonas oryzihabitans TaxID=47885 RepID=UPI00119C9DBD|nr:MULTISPECIES: hypothetical protein [Pseudomonas]UUW72339.1 DUF4177 domain-containing protein [Pseudomonas psychrotolerans]
MSPARFEYHTEFAPLTYRVQERGWLLFKQEVQTGTPDIAAFLADPERQTRLQALGADGWELVSVQPVLEGRAQVGQQTAQGNQGWGVGYAVATGFLLFFKRLIVPIGSQ